jgi:hypothetical protein
MSSGGHDPVLFGALPVDRHRPLTIQVGKDQSVKYGKNRPYSFPTDGYQEKKQEVQSRSSRKCYANARSKSCFVTEPPSKSDDGGHENAVQYSDRPDHPSNGKDADQPKSSKITSLPERKTAIPNPSLAIPDTVTPEIADPKRAAK